MTHNEHLPEKPIFVVGVPRSGTTLLRYILSSHPRIYIPGETGFIPSLRHSPNTELTLAQTERLLQRIGELNREWYDLVADVSLFYDSLPQRNLQFILDALYRQRIKRQGAVRWGDKTPSYVRYISVIDRIFPTAQFVHLIRDGRDSTRSAQAKWGRKGLNRLYMDTYYLLKNWDTSVRAGRADGPPLGPERYLEIRYETLVSQPEQTIQRVCDFLGETLHPDMLDHTQLAREQIRPTGHIEVRAPISASSVSRWKHEMSVFEKKMADRVAGPTLSAAGYELANLGSFSPVEWIRLLTLDLKYLLVDSLRNLLTALGVLTLNRGKRR